MAASWTKCLRCSQGAIAARTWSGALVSLVGVYYQGEARTFLRAIHTWDRGVLAGRPVGHCGSGGDQWFGCVGWYEKRAR